MAFTINRHSLPRLVTALFSGFKMRNMDPSFRLVTSTEFSSGSQKAVSHQKRVGNGVSLE